MEAEKNDEVAAEREDGAYTKVEAARWGEAMGFWIGFEGFGGCGMP